MATIAAKVSEDTAKALRRLAKKEGKTQSELVRGIVEEYLAPPSKEWAKAMLELAEGGRQTRRRGPTKSEDRLSWAIDTTV